MHRSKQKLYLRRIGIFLLIMAITAGVMIGIFYKLYDASKQSIIGSWRNKTKEIAQEFSYYIKMPMDAVSFSAIKVNEMLKDNVPENEVGRYLIDETQVYSTIISDNTTGIYGYYRGTYLDGSGWTPPEDYEPTSRPWYIDAVKGDGEIVTVKPYKNLQTFTMMMSVSQLLDDGESVVSMDIFIDGVQKMIEDISEDKHIQEAFVIDKNGFIVAHTDSNKIAVHLSYDGNETDRELYEILKKEDRNYVEFSSSDGSNIVFIEDVNGVWKTVVVLDKRDTFSSLKSIYVMSGAVLFAIAMTLILLFMYLNEKHRENVELSREVEAIADIYMIVLKIDLVRDTVKTLRFNKGDARSFQSSFKNYRHSALKMADQIASGQFKALLERFMDPNTLEKRLEGINSISQEFIDYNNRWMRIRFIVVGRDEKGSLQQVILAFESIDEDKKRQEAFKKLSETDRMTGIRNRGSGESMIKSRLAEGKSGMFCVMDADNFKAINDNYGHKVGDKVIIEIAKCMQSAFRDSDVVFRLGGDEFAAFADGVENESVGRLVIGRFFEAINNMSIPELGDRKVSISVGAAFYPSSNVDTFDLLYMRADEGAYESKRYEGNFISFK
ncbi:sensor domain-containing diguanylate cyclase [Butyrivibrio sp. MB2005]|uniref:sensor domain-containing diguanylate cyclase n=1 Tax=Butyrivibrio sp. MB2005 TaxID=1280678 RepID=UPI00041B6057|nr:diguanylate cyclase [Butyrivibrio sp. MB2005]